MKADLQGGGTQVSSSSGFLGPESAVHGFFLVALNIYIYINACLNTTMMHCSSWAPTPNLEAFAIATPVKK